MARLLSVVVVAAAVLSTANAMSTFPQRIPNGANVPGIKAIGHVDGTGETSPLTKFGMAFSAAGFEWTVELCKADSDGDGQTNGQELGDPCCQWKVGAKPKFTNGVSHPGDASKKVSAAILASNACGRSNRSMDEVAPLSIVNVNFGTNLTVI